MATNGNVTQLHILIFLTGTISFTPIVAASIEGLYLRSTVHLHSIL